MSRTPTERHLTVQSPEHLADFQSIICYSGTKGRGRQEALGGNRDSPGGPIRTCEVWLWPVQCSLENQWKDTRPEQEGQFVHHWLPDEINEVPWV